MGANYTNLDVSKFAEESPDLPDLKVEEYDNVDISHPSHPDHHKHVRAKFLFPASLTLLIISVSAYVSVNAILFMNKGQAAVKTTTPRDRIYYPIKYLSVAAIPFVPNKIDSMAFDVLKLREQAAKEYPELKAAELDNQLKEDLFVWAAMRANYSSPTLKISKVAPDKAVSDFAAVLADIKAIRAEYEPKVKTFTGQYLKVRFGGVYDKNVKLLNKLTGDLRAFADTTFSTFIQKEMAANKTPEQVLEDFNTDETMLLLNNGELSETFKDLTFEPPLFDDPDLYPMLVAAKPKTWTKTSLLRTPDAKGNLEEYAFIMFYVEEVKGEAPPISDVVRSFIQKADIR